VVKTISRGLLEKLILIQNTNFGFCVFVVGLLAGLNFTIGTELELVVYQALNYAVHIQDVDSFYTKGVSQLHASRRKLYYLRCGNGAKNTQLNTILGCKG
jgi:hypothetical protein